MKAFIVRAMTLNTRALQAGASPRKRTLPAQRKHLASRAFLFPANRIRSLSGVAGKNRHDSGGRKPQGVVPPGGRLYVLDECGRGAQKAVQAPAGDFWKPSHRVKRWDCLASSHRAANVPGMTGKADEVASVCSERDGEYDRPTDRRDFHPKHRSHFIAA